MSEKEENIETIDISIKDGCHHLIIKGKNKGSQCCSKIFKDNLCNKHKKILIKQNFKEYNNYGNPDQTEYWIKWINSVNDEPK